MSQGRYFYDLIKEDSDSASLFEGGGTRSVTEGVHYTEHSLSRWRDSSLTEGANYAFASIEPVSLTAVLMPESFGTSAYFFIVCKSPSRKRIARSTASLEFFHGSSS